jgi:ABC-type multidrug transport system fused ATPase/permease subunit
MRPASRSPAWSEALALLYRHRRPLILACLLVAGNRLAAFAVPIASRYVVDHVIAQRSSGLLAPIVMLTCAALAIEALTGFGAAQLAAVTEQRAQAHLRRQLQQLILGLPVSIHEATQSGALAARIMTDSQQARYLVGNGLVQLLTSILTSLLALGLLFWLSASVTLGVIVVLGLFTLTMAHVFGRLSPAFQELGQHQAEVTGGLSEVLGKIRLVKAYVAERHEAQRFVPKLHALARDAVQLHHRLSMLTALSTLAAGSIGLLLLVVGSRAVVAGTMSLGSFVMYLWLTGLLLAPVIQITAGAVDLGHAMAALGRIAALRECLTEQEEDRARTPAPTVEGAITFEDVWFTYPDGREALRAVSFYVPAGSVMALVGPTGSGKSTVAQLVAALRAPTTGRVLVDGYDLASLRRREYRRNLAVVPQEIALFVGTIADNIRYACPTASMDEVRRAAKLAHCEEFITRLPAGYATPVGEDGVCLSAGQRQRLAIARALLVDPRILILDEPTSHLDTESEALIQESLRILGGSRTVLVIAHRLAAVQRADQVLVLAGGAIVERGTHEELMNRRGRYWQLHEARACYQQAMWVPQYAFA